MTGIDRIGLGCARLMGGSEAASSRKLVEVALALGIRHFDTAPYYGEGASETVLGNVLGGVEGVTVTTKIGIARPAAPPSPAPRGDSTAHSPNPRSLAFRSSKPGCSPSRAARR